MSVDVVCETRIERPVRRVAEFAGDPTNAPTWYVNIKSVDWKTPRPPQVGSRIQFVARFLGRELRYTYQIVELVPLERMMMRTDEGPFPMETTYTWTTNDDGSTNMSLRNRGEPSGFSRLTAPVMAFAMRRANRKDLRRLKTVLEET